MQRSSSTILISKFCLRLITPRSSGKLQPDLYSTSILGWVGKMIQRREPIPDWTRSLPISARQHYAVRWIVYVDTGELRGLLGSQGARGPSLHALSCMLVGHPV